MASLNRKPSGLYLVQFTDSRRTPRRKRVSLETHELSVAETRLKLAEQLVEHGSVDPWSPDARFPWQDDPSEAIDAPARLKTIGGAVEAYMHASRHLSPDTIRTYKSIFELFRNHLGAGFAVERIAADHILDWLDTTETNLTTKHKYVHHLGYIARFLQRQGVSVPDWSKEVRLRSRPQRRPKSMTSDEVESLLRTIKAYTKTHAADARYNDWTYLHHLIRAVCHLGLRLNEVINQRWKDVDLDRRVLSVVKTPEFTPKYGIERTIPMRGAAWEEVLWFKESTTGEFVFTDVFGAKLKLHGLSQDFLKFRRKAELDDEISFHSTRHTCATNLLDAGVPITVVKEFMGHRSVRTTMRYVRPHVEKMDYWIERALTGPNGSLE